MPGFNVRHDRTRARIGSGARDEEFADLFVINTCTVTAEGNSKCRQVIRQLSRRNSGTRIVVMGCNATRAPVQVPGGAEQSGRFARVVAGKVVDGQLMGRLLETAEYA